MSFNHLINIICSLLTPQKIIKLITGKYFVWILGKQKQQVKFLSCQHNFLFAKERLPTLRRNTQPSGHCHFA